MNTILARTALFLAALSVPASLAAASLEGRWKNPRGSVVVAVQRCGDAYCGTVSWASANNRQKGVAPGTRVLSELRPLGDGLYKGRAYDPKRSVGGSATVRQMGPNVMVVKGCVIAGLVCKEQRWTRIS